MNPLNQPKLRTASGHIYAPYPFHTVQWDHAGPFGKKATASGNKLVLNIVDIHTNYWLCIPVGDDSSATTAETLWSEVYTRYGIPQTAQDNEYSAQCVSAISPTDNQGQKKIGEHTWLTTAEDRDSREPRVEHEDSLGAWHDSDKAPLIPKAIGPEAVIHGKVIEEILEHKEVPGGMLYLVKWKGYTNEGDWIHSNALYSSRHGQDEIHSYWAKYYLAPKEEKECDVRIVARQEGGMLAVRIEIEL
ncbi:hypothetical protein Pelo_19314 [Pelomyxa schiedti]|nr:hypothetical protein Pelo_19314 [Pelomyxa schiedti]